MSWTDRLANTIFTITTGDGKVWTPLWKSGETNKEFNNKTFDFINKAGSFTDRRQVKARHFPLVFWFQGDDNLDISDAFDQSANDNRNWTVNHPFYGIIIGQPLSISRNDSNYNVTEINVDFWENILTLSPKTKLSVQDHTDQEIVELQTLSATDYGSAVALKPKDVSGIKDNVNFIDATITKILDAVHYNDYQTLKNSVFVAANDITVAPVDGIAQIQKLILEPANFLRSVDDRIFVFEKVFNSVLSKVTSDPSRNNKFYFQATAGLVIAGAALAAILPFQGDYLTRYSVLATADKVSGLYSTYLKTLDALYVPMNNTSSSFSPSPGTQNSLQSLVINTIANLSNIAFSAKQERIAFLEKDDNLITLTHKYLGLDADDNNLSTFRNVNNIKNNLLFIIPKGTQIKYYV